MQLRKLFRQRIRHRRGIAALFFGVMLPVFIGLTALSVDLSLVAVARSQLSTAADAGALAGIMKLVDARVQGYTDLTSAISTANTAATQLIQANPVLGQTLVVVANPNNTSSGDIVVGYLDPTIQPLPSNTPPDTSAANKPNSNAVQVTTARDSNHGSVVPSFFSRLMGFQGSSPSVTSTAIAQNFQAKGVTSVGNFNAPLLPIVLDVTTYNNMISRNSNLVSDQYTWNPATQTVTSGSDGLFESSIFPVTTTSPGNLGTINVGVTNNSTKTLGDQIQYGITPAQLATFPNSTIALDTTQTPPQITFSGNPGVSAGIKSALDAIIGDPVMIPIYDINGGNGNNAWFRVIAFAPVRIMAVNFQGSNKYVIVQPASIQTPTAIPDTKKPQPWNLGGVVEVYLAR